jgi:hypothetical protein
MKNIIATNIYNATITASSENPDYLFSVALTDSRLSRLGQTLTTGAQWIKFSFTGSVDADTICLFKANFTSSATVKIQANATDVWTSPSVDQALTYTKDDRRSTELGRNVGTWSHQFSSTESYQYWRLYIDDSSNPDTYLELGFMFMDEATVFPGMSVNQVFMRNTTSETQFSTSGQAYGLKRLQYNMVSFNFPAVTETQKTTLDTFYDKTDIVTPYCMLVWESSLDVQRPLYVINTNLPEWTRIEGLGGVMWTYNQEIREVF